MARPRKTDHETNREDDFRDYKARDVDSGWPYADDDSVGGSENRPYGEPPANFDRTGDPGAEIANDPAIRSRGGPDVLPDQVEDVIADDDLEDRIAQLLENDPRLESTRITVRVRNSVAEISGRVDTDEERIYVVRLVRAVPGVRDATEDLISTGADAHIPRDADE